MNRHYAVIVCLAAASCLAADTGVNAAIEGGTVSFVVNTTVPGISVKGKSTALEAHAIVQRVAKGLHLENLQATVAVKSLLTGMAIRDEHMRRYIFTTSDGKTPDLHFEAAGAACEPQSGHGNEFSCPVSGTLAIRGVARPFSIPLKIHDEGRGFRAGGESTIKLSDYDIEQPSQFGVKTENEIRIRLEFTGKEAHATVASGGSR